MNDEQRDELLIRIDERVKDIKEEELPEIKQLLRNHSRRIRVIEIIIGSLVVSGGSIAGLIKLLS